MAERAATSGDAYFLGLVSCVLHNVGRDAEAEAVGARLAALQDASGSLRGSTTSITRSRGRALAVETAAVAALSWLPFSRFAANAELAVQFLAAQCVDGKFASTQGTILTLKALTEYRRLRRPPQTPFDVRLSVNGRDVALAGAAAVDPASSPGAVVYDIPAALLARGSNTFCVALSTHAGVEENEADAAASTIPYSFSVTYVHDQPPTSPFVCSRTHTHRFTPCL